MINEEQFLSDRNIKPTAVRLLVLRFLMKEEKAVSLKSLEEHFVYSDKSTLFRTLKTFEKQKLIHAIDDGSGMTKYALCLQTCECVLEDQHFHFHCTKCQETYCLNSHSVPTIKLPTNFSMQQANLVIKGICADCN